MNTTTVMGGGAEISYAPSLGAAVDDPPDIVCLSRTRWDSARQRPQHLMSRSARGRRVFFVEEPVFGAAAPGLDIRRSNCGVFVVRPRLREGPDDAEAPATEQALLLDELFLEYEVRDYILWYYTPTALAFTWRLDPLLVVYDCAGAPPAFESAAPGVGRREAELLELADMVFTGGHGLYEANRRLHHNVHLFPDGVGAETLASSAWDETWARMMNLIDLTLKKLYSGDLGAGIEDRLTRDGIYFDPQPPTFDFTSGAWR